MATHSVTRSKTATLTAATADTVTVTGTISKLQVVNHGTTRISVTYNGAAATVDGDNTIPVPPGGVTVLYDKGEVGDAAVVDSSVDHVVSLISSSTPTYCVVGF